MAPTKPDAAPVKTLEGAVQRDICYDLKVSADPQQHFS